MARPYARFLTYVKRRYPALTVLKPTAYNICSPLKVVANMRSRRFLIPGLALSLSSVAFFSFAADNKPAAKSAAPQRETVAKPLTDKEPKRHEAKLTKQPENPYTKWLNEAV